MKATDSRASLLLRPLSALVAAFFLSSCIDIARKSEMDIMYSDLATRQTEAREENARKIDQLNQNILTLAKGQTDIRNDMLQIKEYLEVVGGKVDDSRTKFSDFILKKESVQMLREQIESLQEKIYSMISSSSSVSAAQPARIFELASADYMRGNMDLAKSGFELFLKEGGSGENAAQAYYQLGIIAAAAGRAADAESAFSVIISTYPASDMLPKALFKTALIAEGRKDAAKAMALYERIMKEFPLSDESKLSRDRLIAAKKK